MGAAERLIAAGLQPECAQETVLWYQTQGDDCGLEKYLTEVESRNADSGKIFMAKRKSAKP